MNEGLNDRKCGTAANLACAVTKQVSLHTSVCTLRCVHVEPV